MLLAPFRKTDTGLQRLQNEMERMFQHVLGDFNYEPLGGGWIPPMDLSETDKEVVLRAELPGVASEDVDISFKDNMLTISGEKKSEAECSEEGYRHTERTYGSFRRSLTLPTNIETDKIDATFKDGVLTVRLPKTETAQARHIKLRKA